jgi:hypothetical protein
MFRKMMPGVKRVDKNNVIFFESRFSFSYLSPDIMLVNVA